MKGERKGGIYIIYTPNLGYEITVPGREKEQGRFRGSIEGAKKERYRAVQGRGRWKPEMASFRLKWLPSVAV